MLKIGVPLLAVFAMTGNPTSAGELNGIVSRLDLSEWVGQWAAHAEQSITITLPDKKGLEIEGLTANGALDPGRSAIGAVNVAAFSVRIPSRWIYANNQIDIAIGPDGDAVVATMASEDDCILSLRLDWNINWIDVTDNGRCEGLNMRFTGRYEPMPLAE